MCFFVKLQQFLTDLSNGTTANFQPEEDQEMKSAVRELWVLLFWFIKIVKLVCKKKFVKSSDYSKSKKQDFSSNQRHFCHYEIKQYNEFFVKAIWSKAFSVKLTQDVHNKSVSFMFELLRLRQLSCQYDSPLLLFIRSKCVCSTTFRNLWNKAENAWRVASRGAIFALLLQKRPLLQSDVPSLYFMC